MDLPTTLARHRKRLILEHPVDEEQLQRARLMNREAVRLIPGPCVHRTRFAPARAAAVGDEYRQLLIEVALGGACATGAVFGSTT